MDNTYKLGNQWGRKYNIEWSIVAEKYNSGLSIYDLEKELKISASLIWWHLKKLGVIFNNRSSQKSREKISLAMKKRYKNNPSSFFGHTCFWKGKKRPEHSLSLIGRITVPKIIKNCVTCGKAFATYECQHIKTCSKICKNISHAMSITGDKNHNWQDGISQEEYGLEFNKPLKQRILLRDNHICQYCYGNGANIVHHIDYDKKNNSPYNLISLHRKCHFYTNFNRIYWHYLFTIN